ncbi:MAG: sugar phosphate isomerase/epimerase [Verrucomicrobiaceae bacterium]|nr:sugar phosphate isomerase/epimerase [Verrucomicrobiaceae bacterium]
MLRFVSRLSLGLICFGSVAVAGQLNELPGLQLYSLRSQFKLRGADWTLDQVKALGIKTVELASGVPDLTPLEMKKKLDERGLTAISSHFSYKRYKDDVAGIIQDAKTLGLKYVGCAWIDHKDAFDEAECRDAINTFNQAGEALAKEGIGLYYHFHGFEFQPHGDGTLFDLFMKETKPEFVSCQMDVLWIVFPGQSPVQLLKKYPNRWILSHLKDLRKGVATGSLTGHTDVNNNVPLGTGQVDWKSFFKAASEAGIKHHLIEDESDSVLKQMPQHLDYLKTLSW